MGDDLLSYQEAAARVASFATERIQTRPATERVELAYAAGRVLAKPLCADADQPPFARSTRDGYACRADEAAQHGLLRLTGSTHAGSPPAGPLLSGEAWEIMTGAPVPEGADAVAMLEHVEVLDGHIRLHDERKLKPGANIVAQGAQAVSGEELLPVGTILGPAQIALAAACGAAILHVYIRPRVAILTTGDELVPVQTTPGPGQIRNSNAPMLAALVASAGGDPWVFPAIADTPAALSAAIKHAASPAAQADLLLLSGGVSAGKFDLVEPALAKAGASFFFTGAQIQPGKPVVFGELKHCSNEMLKGFGDLLRGSILATAESPLPFFGLPGNPVSSAVTFLLFAAPLMAAMAGCRELGPHFVLARLTESVPGKNGLTRFLPALCDANVPMGSLPEVKAVATNGSGDLAALGRCNCFLMLPDELPNPEVGDFVRILPL
jgi:molybdopterin molybdotransferase